MATTAAAVFDCGLLLFERDHSEQIRVCRITIIPLYSTAEITEHQCNVMKLFRKSHAVLTIIFYLCDKVCQVTPLNVWLYTQRHSLRSFVCSFVRLIVRLFVRSFVRTFVRSFVHSFVDLPQFGIDSI